MLKPEMENRQCQLYLVNPFISTYTTTKETTQLSQPPIQTPLSPSISPKNHPPRACAPQPTPLTNSQRILSLSPSQIFPDSRRFPTCSQRIRSLRALLSGGLVSTEPRVFRRTAPACWEVHVPVAGWVAPRLSGRVFLGGSHCKKTVWEKVSLY